MKLLYIWNTLIISEVMENVQNGGIRLSRSPWKNKSLWGNSGRWPRYSLLNRWRPGNISFYPFLFSIIVSICSLYSVKGNVHRCCSKSKCSPLNDSFSVWYADFIGRQRVWIRGCRPSRVSINLGPNCGLVQHDTNPISLHMVKALYILHLLAKFTMNFSTSVVSPSTNSKNA